MSSMGKLLALSLLCTLAAAALYQPALMSPARKADLADRAEHLPRDVAVDSEKAMKIDVDQRHVISHG
jgi:hypothetical protein